MQNAKIGCLFISSFIVGLDATFYVQFDDTWHRHLLSNYPKRLGAPRGAQIWSWTKIGGGFAQLSSLGCNLTCYWKGILFLALVLVVYLYKCNLKSDTKKSTQTQRISSESISLETNIDNKQDFTVFLSSLSRLCTRCTHVQPPPVLHPQSTIFNTNGSECKWQWVHLHAPTLVVLGFLNVTKWNT